MKDKTNWREIHHRFEIIKSFLQPRMKEVRTLAAWRRRLQRHRQWKLNDEETVKLSAEWNDMIKVELRFILNCHDDWHKEHPNIDPPSFKPSAILSRVYRARRGARERITHDSPIPLSPELEQLLQDIEDIVECYCRSD